MPFPPGTSGNPNGRPKGSANKSSGKVRDFIATLLDDGGEKLKTELDKLEGKEYVRAYTELLPYVVPRLQSGTLDIELEHLSDDQLNILFERIMESSK